MAGKPGRSGGARPGAGRPPAPASAARDETLAGVLDAEWRGLDLSKTSDLYRALRLIGEAALSGMWSAQYLGVLADCVREARQVGAQALVSVRLESVERSLAKLELAKSAAAVAPASGPPSDLAFSDEDEDDACGSPLSDSVN